MTVLERNDRIGGLLRYGIPTMKLSKEVVQRRVDLLASEGVVFRTGVEVGKNLPAADLMRDFDATLLAMGSTTPRDLPIPGRELNGILFAVPFLEGWQRHQWKGQGESFGGVSAEGKHVIVMGGGDTGCDCIGTSLRLVGRFFISLSNFSQLNCTRYCVFY